MRTYVTALAVLALAASATCDSGSPQQCRSNVVATTREFSAGQLARARAVSEQLDAARLRAHVEELFRVRQAEEPTYMTFGVPHVRAASAEYITATLRSLGYAPTIEESNTDGILSQNIYVDVRGASLGDEIIVLAAHYDAFHKTGADDNASGVAILLEAARVVQSAGLARTVRVLAFDNEERGLVGSNRYVNLHGCENVVLVINMDCMAYARHERGSQRAPLGFTGLRDTGDFLAAFSNPEADLALSQLLRLGGALAQPLEVVGLRPPGDALYPGTRDFTRSDHAPFWRRGVPGIFLSDTANFRNPNYHQVTDTPDTLDYDFFTRAARLTVAAVAAYGERP